MIEAPASENTPRRLGVVGTLVWDTIKADRDLFAESLARAGRLEAVGENLSSTVEEWGGIAYSLAALDTVLAPDWEIVPIIKIGSDLRELANEFLELFPRMDLRSGIRTVPDPNNRVELRYSGAWARTERLTGGVPPWLWNELQPILSACDALYVNFVSGFEMDLETARMLKTEFAGPVYADLHSLFLGVGQGGLRRPRELPSADFWLQCFDAVQMNEEEFGLFAAAVDDPWAYAASCLGDELKLIAVTLGARGSSVLAHRAGAGPDLVRVRPERNVQGDPTGCGDVWGATFLARLLDGEELRLAMTKANRIASENAEHRGARALCSHLSQRCDSADGQ